MSMVRNHLRLLVALSLFALISLLTLVQTAPSTTAAGTGSFAPHPTTPAFGAGWSSDVALGDLDGDGDLDAVVANDAGEAETVWLNDGVGNLSAHPTTPSFGGPPLSSPHVALGDLDGDGDLDAVVANHNGRETVWVNDGAGNFSAHPTTPEFGSEISFSLEVTLGDLDGDGDLDAVVANGMTDPGTVWLNDGAGNFSAHPTTPSFGGHWSHAVALGDLDGDGDLDGVVANEIAQAETVWVNDGAGNFSAHPTTPFFGAGQSYDVSLGDLDGDGDLDAVAANYSFEPETVWLNDGAGNFSAHPITPFFGAGSSFEVVLGDLDEDGDLDAVVANDNGEPETVWLNNGAGIFSSHPATPSFGAGSSLGMALGDLDGDGDLDAVVANAFGQSETVWLNNATDSDGDGIANDADNCPTVANPDQANADGDGMGDACDADDDNDGVLDTADECSNTPAGTEVNSAGCPLAVSKRSGCPSERATYPHLFHAKSGIPYHVTFAAGAYR